ncbi:unnamed protein product [Staurois parvus]|uniref:Uncharacterized protein n=1 Tax=Staurois parvus TaxID=386267 RepID=A0ABN9APA8_9NEOB|nr:unnamed protein product [Staurois parvus]
MSTLIRQSEPIVHLHMFGLVCIAREVFFFSFESACDQHRANQRCPDRGQGFCILLEQKENSYNALLKSQDCSNC